MKKKKLVAKITSVCVLLGMTLGSTMMVSAANEKYFTDLAAEEGKPYVLPFLEELKAPEFNWEHYKTNTRGGELTLRDVAEYRLVLRSGEECIPYGHITDDELGYFDDKQITDLETALKNTSTLSYLDTFTIDAVEWLGSEDEQVYRDKMGKAELLVVNPTKSDIIKAIPLAELNNYVAAPLTQKEMLKESYPIRVATKVAEEGVDITIAWNITDMTDREGTLVEVDSLAIVDKEDVELALITATESDEPDHVFVLNKHLSDGDYKLIYTIKGVDFTTPFTVKGVGVGEEFKPDTEDVVNEKEALISVSDIPEKGVYTHESLDITFRSDMDVSFTFNGTTYPNVGTEFTFNVTENGDYTFEAITESGMVTTGEVPIHCFTEKDEFAIEDRDEFWEGKSDFEGLVQTGILSSATLVLGVILLVGGAVVLVVKGGKKKNEK